jgi:hypothetical protein
MLALNGPLGNTQDMQKERSVHSQKLRHLGQLPGR